MRTKWEVTKTAVTRNGVRVAEVFRGRTSPHFSNCRMAWGWNGLGMERHGHDDLESVKRDVMYFYRYGNGSQMTVTYRSGRTERFAARPR